MVHLGSCWQNASVICHTSFSIGQVEQSHSMITSFPQNQLSEREQGRSCNVFMTQCQKSQTVISAIFSWLHRPTLKQGWRGLRKRRKTKKIIRGHLRAWPPQPANFLSLFSQEPIQTAHKLESNASNLLMFLYNPFPCFNAFFQVPYLPHRSIY